MPFAVLKDVANIIIRLRPIEEDELKAILTHWACDRRQLEALIGLCPTDACVFVLASDDFGFDFGRVAHCIFLMFDDYLSPADPRADDSRVWLGWTNFEVFSCFAHCRLGMSVPTNTWCRIAEPIVIADPSECRMPYDAWTDTYCERQKETPATIPTSENLASAANVDDLLRRWRPGW
jgi:hypothetical protein